MSKWANQEEHVSRELKKKERAAELSAVGENGLAPVGSLMFMEVERRIDVVVFRSCFTHSVYEARRLVIHGNVMLNGKVVRTLSSALWPGLVRDASDALHFAWACADVSFYAPYSPSASFMAISILCYGNPSQSQ